MSWIRRHLVSDTGTTSTGISAFGYFCKAKSSSNIATPLIQSRQESEWTHNNRTCLAAFLSLRPCCNYAPTSSDFWSLQRANTSNGNNANNSCSLSKFTKPFHIKGLKPGTGGRQKGVLIFILPRKKTEEQKDKVTCSKSKRV